MESIVIEHLAAKQRTMRLSIVTETYPPEVNGVALSLSRFVEGLRQLNHDIQLIRPRQQEEGEIRKDLGIEEVLTTGLPIPKYPNLKVGLPAKRRLVAQWSKNRPDLVHIVTEGPLGWSALEAARKLRIPVSSDFRTNFHSYSQHYGIGWLKRPIVGYLRKFHNKTAITTVPTERMRSELTAIGFRNVRVLSRGVNAVLYDPARRSEDLRARFGLSKDNFTLVYVGRLAAEKNLDLLIKAYERLKSVDPKVRLLLVGDGPEKTVIQARVPDALFAGMQIGEDLATHYASADLFVFPSKTETFGNVTLEAMASGLPVVAFDYAAAAQYVTPENGCLADIRRDDEFIRGCLDMHAKFSQDYKAYLDFGNSSRARAERESWPVVVKEFESLLIEAIRKV